MEFLKDALGEKFDEFCGLISSYNEKNPETAMSIIDANGGGYIEKEKYTALEKKYEKEVRRLEAEAKDARFNSELELLLIKEKPKNTKALKALLDFEKISYDDGVIVGFDEQIKKLKASDSYLFEGEKAPNFTRPVSGEGGSLTREDYKKLSYMEKLKLKKESPKIFSKLK